MVGCAVADPFASLFRAAWVFAGGKDIACFLIDYSEPVESHTAIIKDDIGVHSNVCFIAHTVMANKMPEDCGDAFVWHNKKKSNEL
jgi:hypothetical protein